MCWCPTAPQGENFGVSTIPEWILYVCEAIWPYKTVSNAYELCYIYIKLKPQFFEKIDELYIYI